MSAPLSFPLPRLLRFLPMLLVAPMFVASVDAVGAAYLQGEPPAGLAAGLEAIERHDRAGFRLALETVERQTHGESIRLYLQTRWLLERVDEEPAAVAAQLREHPQDPLAPLLKRRYLDHLAEQESWGQYQLVFERAPEITAGTRRQCAYWEAELALEGTLTGDQADEALAVWQQGRSQPEACDPAFAWLESNDYLDAAAYRARIRAAVTAGQDGLARYLVRRGPTGLVAYRDRWIALRDRPATAVAERIEAEGDAEAITQGLLWLAKKDPARARELLERASRLELVDDEQAGSVARLAALKAAYRYEPQAYEWLREVPLSARDHEVWTWTVRSALRHLDWSRVKRAIDAMPEEIAAEREWRFWRAEADHRLGQKTAARQAWRELAETPDYHGFLAADRLGIRYPLPAEAIEPPQPADEAVADLEGRPWLALAFALQRLDRPEDARRLFEHALDNVADERLPALAWLADQAGWADRASVVLARMKAFHDPEWLAARYATPYRSLVEAQAERQAIPPAWVYSVMRRESLFMRDIGSGVGAQGLMQLMPATGRWINRQADLGLAPLRLTDPGTNIALGAAYLGHMAERFDERYPLAIAAYNAGPGRVRDWLPEVPLPGDVWVDTILFDETRAYARAVLAGMVIYHWRLTGRPERLGTLLPVIPSAD
ncbi:lytic transglycosylase domain-containing protein [Guyparkeria hydrothermalis]|uniref:lytic transglycosylase domain-containing protein n=1 Tax=Guyparkeria hydrothermalis TaxID=923 RepID=UPI0020209A44|nr:lytic transglycosylase domain-containing protein [Guyparkeria hydrothermalis]MCL7745373.1 lytic transglycosylase domain-containing protein [Guyparkeria hydrothermalis]